MNKAVHSGRGLAKRLTALLTALLMVLGMMPLGELAYAETVVVGDFTVSSITYSTIKKDSGDSKVIRIIGTNLKDADIEVEGGVGEYAEDFKSDSISVFDIEIEKLTTVKSVTISRGSQSMMIELKPTKTTAPDFEFKGMPDISGIENRIVYKNDTSLVINGSLLETVKDKLNDTETKNSYFIILSNTAEPEKLLNGSANANSTTSMLKIDTLNGKLGKANISIGYRYTNVDGIDIAIEDVYSEKFKLIEKIDLPDISMTPNKGRFPELSKKILGDQIEFTSSSNLSEYDVFLVKNPNDIMTAKNKCTDRQYKSIEDGSKTMLTVRVPEIATGDYYVVLTNRIGATGNLEDQITKQYTLENQKFTVVAAANKVKIDSVSPIKGPDIGGTEVEVIGRYIITIPEVSDVKPAKIAGSDDITIEEDGTALIKYDPAGKLYNGKTINSLERRVKVIIGLQTTASNEAGKYSFSTNGDKITIKTKGTTDDISDYAKDIKIITETRITTADGTYLLIENDIYKDKFQYESSKIEPEVKSIMPQQIFVEETAEGLRLKEDTLILIEGKNFFIQKYDDDLKKPHTSYPVILLANGIKIDKNANDKLEVTILDDKGNVLDGSEGKQLGSKMIIKIPKVGAYTNEDIRLGTSDVKVTNLIKNSSEYGISNILQDGVEFVEINANSAPKIDSVDPDVVTLEGGQTITIKGSNFNGDVKVLIDGKEIGKITRQPDGKQITFTVPAGREGTTQLQVINPGVGIAITEFRYVKAYTDPKITSIMPNKGTKGTHVVIKGQNFLEPNTSGYTKENGDILKLLGSRVKMDGKDVNEYNLDSLGKIEPTGFNATEDILKVAADGKLSIADYYNSIVLLKDGLEEKWYTLDVSPKDGITLSCGPEVYTITADSNKNIKAMKKTGETYGETYKVELSSVKVGTETFDSIKLMADKAGVESFELIVQTPYKVEDDKITGNNVKVKVDGDIYEIYLTVPDLGVTGKYDVTVANPDTRNVTVKDGFEYTAETTSKPNIEAVTPSKGNADGGYIITITGVKEGVNDCFVSYASGGKTRVIINGIEAKDVQIITPEKLTAVVPPLGFDLQKKLGVKDLMVPVTVINPDGASDTKENLFEYVIPSSKPKIAYINPAQGSASGGDIVEIVGEDFRKEGSQIPKVYFGSNEATVQGDVSSGYMKVRTPPATGTAKTVDVYVVNPDAGVTKEKMKFTYNTSKPVIKSVSPKVGNKAGGEEINIVGSDFRAGDVKIYGSVTSQMTLVRFGELSNRSDANSGKLYSAEITVELPGGLKAEYNGDAKTVNLKVSINNIEYSSVVNYDYEKDGILYVPLKLLKNNSVAIDTNELVRLEVTDGRLIVERGYANGADLLGTTDISVKTIPYPTIGKVGVFVINPDGGQAKGDFEYKNPSSKPSITNIQKDSKDPEDGDGKEKIVKATYKGGSAIKIIGQDFRENAKVLIGSLATIEPAQIDSSVPGELSFTMPAVPESEVGKKIEVFVENTDGGIASSQKSNPQIYIVFTKGESAPQIESITPAKGPSRGGEEAVIKGTDFRVGLSVIFGGKTVEPANITLIDYKTIKVKTPAHPSGAVDVKVENPDGELATLSGGYTFISSPAISKLYDADGKAEIKSLSINGGQKITVKGSGFQSGARVVFMPEIEAVSGEGDIYIGSKTYKLKSSVEAAGVEFIDENTIRVTTPEGKLKGNGIMVINPDKGASEIFAGANYGLEKPAAPEGVTAELIYDDKAVRITWSPVEGAREYEIYASEDDDSYELAASTTGTSYVYQGVESKTSYRFKVKAIGSIATSDASRESNKVTTGSKAGYPDTDGKLSENTSASMSGDRASVTIGTSSYKNGVTIDLTAGSLAGATSATISMPSDVVKSSSAGDIKVIGRDFTVQFSPYAFRDALASSDEASGIKLAISPAYSSSEPGNTALSGEYKIEATAYEKGTERAIYTAGGPIYITLDFDRQKVQMRRLSNIFISWRDPSSSTWEKEGEITATYDSAVTARVYRLGSYRVTGSK